MVERPLDIHWLTIEFLNSHTNARQLSRLHGCKHCARALAYRNRFFTRAFRAAHRHHFFLTDLLCSNRPACLVNHDSIRSDLPTHNGLTQSPGGVDHHLVAFASQWIAGEEDTGCISQNEFLHHHRQTYLLVRDARSCAIANRSCSPQRCPATFDGIKYHRFPVQTSGQSSWTPLRARWAGRQWRRRPSSVSAPAAHSLSQNSDRHL